MKATELRSAKDFHASCMTQMSDVISGAKHIIESVEPGNIKDTQRAASGLAALMNHADTLLNDLDVTFENVIKGTDDAAPAAVANDARDPELDSVSLEAVEAYETVQAAKEIVDDAILLGWRPENQQKRAALLNGVRHLLESAEAKGRHVAHVLDVGAGAPS